MVADKIDLTAFLVRLIKNFLAKLTLKIILIAKNIATKNVAKNMKNLNEITGDEIIRHHDMDYGRLWNTLNITA